MSLVPNEPIGITIRVRDQTGEETMFKVKRSTTMGKLFNAYAQRKGVGRASLNFLLDGECLRDTDTPQSLGLEDDDQIDCILIQAGMISTFTSNDASDALINYLMMTDEERANDTVPIAELREKAKAKKASPFLTFNYQEDPAILHESQRKILCELLEFVWEDTATNYLLVGDRDRVDMRLTLTSEQLVTILASLDSFLDDKYKSSCLNEKFEKMFGIVPNAETRGGHKIALRMTRGPTKSCIGFHCDGSYATSTSQIPLNPTSEYDGGALCFFVNDHLQKVPRVPGSLVQHPRNVLHGVTSVTKGARKSLFIVDEANGLGQGGVIALTSDHVVSFFLRASNCTMGKKRPHEECSNSSS